MQILTFLGFQMISRSPYSKIIYGVKFGTEVWTLLKNGVFSFTANIIATKTAPATAEKRDCKNYDYKANDSSDNNTNCTPIECQIYTFFWVLKLSENLLWILQLWRKFVTLKDYLKSKFWKLIFCKNLGQKTKNVDIV